ncbi:P pilus assembly chaperone PapD [Stenotrophomonas rhizophila]|uniref:pilus assembly protein n=1 Tax=Stenotrophomonas rhizophila TaxID=216778 RepID=UPI000F98150C|nr:pilus assembly protein [Stenotrophomonas rhizophila]ROP80335.1 P pilus assembly chaperone PapD [Stenotrophomonas rhizophila]
MNRMTAPLCALFLLAAGAVAAPAYANMSVHPMRLAVHDARGGQIRVHSQSTRVQYVQLRVQRLLDPATPDEREVDVAPGALEGIAVTPGKFVLAGGGNRLVRVIPLAAVDEEAAYRVYFEGVRPPSEIGTGDEPEESSANIGVNLIWGALVHLIPAQPVADMRVDGNTLHNTGNVRLGVTEIQACDAQNQCTAHTIDHSVYPGVRFPLPFDTAGKKLTVTYRLSYASYEDRQHVLMP